MTTMSSVNTTTPITSTQSMTSRASTTTMSSSESTSGRRSSSTRSRVVGATAAAVAALAALALLDACGPSNRGLEARKAANARFDRANAQVVYDQARQALATGQFEIALGHIDKAIERFPKEPSYYILRGRILIEQRRTHQAKETLDQAVVLDPKSSEAQYFLGVLEQQCGNDAAALAHYEKARTLDPKNLQFLAACAEMRLAAGDPKGAKELVESGSSTFQYSPVLQQIRASCLAMSGENDAAAQIMEQASARSPDDATLAEDLLHSQFDAGNWAECLRVLDMPVMAATRNRPDIVRLRARCLILTDRAVEARDLLERSVTGGEPTVEHLIALGYASWAAGDWDRMAKCGERLVSAHPRLPDGYLFLGAVERERGNLVASDRWLEQASVRDESRELVTKLRSRVQAQLAHRGDTAQGG